MKRTWMMLGAASVMVVGCNGTTYGNGFGYDGPGGYNGSPDPSDPNPFDQGSDFDAGTQKGPQPSFKSVHLNDAPPPISGGTLLVTSDGDHVVAADPDRDQLYVASLKSNTLVKTLSLSKYDEPGRVAEDGAHRVHVALRRGGAVVTIDPVAGSVLARRDVCPSPRGIAYDPTGDRMIVACEGGELVGVPSDTSGAPALIARLDRDLRDVVVDGTHLYVSRFRNAEVLDLDAQGTVLARSVPDVSFFDANAKPTLAWRMIAAPHKLATPSKPVVVHEIAGTQGGAPVSTSQGGYGTSTFSPTDCGSSIITSAISPGDGTLIQAPTQVVLPVDIATDGTTYAVVAAGNGHTPDLPQVFLLAAGENNGLCADVPQVLFPTGQAIAIASLPGGRYLVQSREPAQLEFLSGPTDVDPELPATISLATSSREDTGHAIFHANSGAGIACASCHGEGGDDGHVWTFDQEGPRRTPSLRGTLDGTAPYHWNGEMADISKLSDAVMTGRMNGPSLDDPQKQNLQSWLFTLPALPAPSGLDAAAVARGKAIFESTDAGCTSCHSGARFTSSATVNVGTGDAFQVPSLIGVGARAPFLHDGCAATLTDRFGACGGSKHGNTSSLSAASITDLVTYLQSL
jgi:mono/diheme cytochrome c family protein